MRTAASRPKKHAVPNTLSHSICSLAVCICISAQLMKLYCIASSYTYRCLYRYVHISYGTINTDKLEVRLQYKEVIKSATEVTAGSVWGVILVVGEWVGEGK